MDNTEDYYVILGVPRDASEAEIKHAYKRLALRYHADRNNSEEAKEVFLAINEAYAELSDPDKRRLYDASWPTLFARHGKKYGFSAPRNPNSAAAKAAAAAAAANAEAQAAKEAAKEAASRPNSSEHNSTRRWKSFRFIEHPPKDHDASSADSTSSDRKSVV